MALLNGVIIIILLLLTIPELENLLIHLTNVEIKENYNSKDKGKGKGKKKALQSVPPTSFSS